MASTSTSGLMPTTSTSALALTKTSKSTSTTEQDEDEDTSWFKTCFVIVKFDPKDGIVEPFRYMQFNIFPNFNYVHDIMDMAEEAGAEFKEFDEAEYNKEPRPEFVINLINFEEMTRSKKNQLQLLPNDGYDIQFLLDFMKNPPETDLKDHQITHSNYKSHNVNDILNQEQSWNNLVPLKNPPARKSIKDILKSLEAIRQRGYDSYSSSDSTDEDDEPKKQNNRTIVVQREEPESAEKVVDVVGEDNHDQNPLDPPQPPASLNQTRGQVTFFVETFVPLRDNRNRVIRKGKNEGRRMAPGSTWLAVDANDEIVGEAQNTAGTSKVQDVSVPVYMESDPGIDYESSEAEENVVEVQNTAGTSKIQTVTVPALHMESDIGINYDSSGEESSGNVQTRPGPGPAPVPVVGLPKQTGSKKRRSGTRAQEYTRSDSQHMLNLIVANNWGRFVKGNKLWQFIEKKKLLEQKIGTRTYQGMLEHFKKHILPSVMSSNCPFILSRQDRAAFKLARETAAQKPHANIFEPPHLESVKRI